MNWTKTTILTLFAILLTFTILQNRDFWVDESYSYITVTQYPFTHYIAQHPTLFLTSIILMLTAAYLISKNHKKTAYAAAALSIIAYALSHTNPKDAHAPGYYTLLHHWTNLTGTTTYAMRSLSAITIILAALALYHYCQKWHDTKTANTATLLFAISSTVLHYGTETRMYSLLILLGILSTHQLRLIIQENKPTWTYSIIIIIMAHLHYFTAVLLLAHVTVMLTHKTSLQKIQQATLPIILTLTPLILYFLQQKARITNMYLKPPTPLTWFSSIGFSLNQPKNLKATINEPILILAAVALLALITYAAIKKDNKWTWTEAALTTLPQMLGILIAIFYFTYHPRYFLMLLWLVPVLAAQGIHAINNKTARTITLLIIIALTLTITLKNQPNTELQDCTNTMIQDSLTQHWKTNYTILHETPFSSLPARYYTRNHPQYTHYWLTNFTKPMRNSMNGDTTQPQHIIMKTEQIPHIDYYYEHDQYISTQNMTLIRNCNGLHLWRTNQ